MAPSRRGVPKVGFKVPRKTFRLVFDDPDYQGAEVVCRSVVLAKLFEVTSLSDKPEEMFVLFGDEVLQEWNLEDDAGLIPANGKGMLRAPVEFANALVKAWTEGLTSVVGPLGQQSPAGSTSPELSMSMATLSGNHVS